MDERERTFARVALALEYITIEQLRECIESAPEEGGTIADLLMEKGHISEEDAREIWERVSTLTSEEEEELPAVAEMDFAEVAPPSKLPIIVGMSCAVLVFVLLLGIVLLVSRRKGEEPRPRESGVSVEIAEYEYTPVPEPSLAAKTPLQLEEADTFAAANPNDFRAIEERYLKIAELSGDEAEATQARSRLGEVIERCDAEAASVLAELVKEAEKLVSEKRFLDAVRKLDEFPERLRVKKWQAEVEKAKESYRDREQAFLEEELARADELARQGKTAEARRVYESIVRDGTAELAERARAAVSDLEEAQEAEPLDFEKTAAEVRTLLFEGKYDQALERCDALLKDPAYQLYTDTFELLRDDAILLKEVKEAALSGLPSIKGKLLRISGISGTVTEAKEDAIVIESGKARVKKTFSQLQPTDIVLIAGLGDKKRAVQGRLRRGIFLLYSKSLDAAEKELRLAAEDKKDVSHYLRLLAVLRAEIAAQSVKGPTRRNLPPGMVYVPAGEFIMGSGDGHNDETPVRRVFLDAYFIDRFEVTNEEYKKFVDATGHGAPPHWKDGTYADGRGKHPVTMVSYDDAASYAKWAGKRLPTEAEWEKAARGKDGNVYPWGDALKPNRCRSAWEIERKPLKTLQDIRRWFEEWKKQKRNEPSMAAGGPTSAAGTHRSGDSPFGCADMAGNVREWVADWYIEDYYVTAPAFNPKGPDVAEQRVTRGGSYLSPPSGKTNSLRCADREPCLPFERSTDLGFRCALDAPPELVSVPLEKYQSGLIFALQERMGAEGAPKEAARPEAPEGMVLIPEGVFIMGDDDGEKKEGPRHKVYLDGFYIDTYEVTNAQYKKFIDETHHRPPLHWVPEDKREEQELWKYAVMPEGRENHPVTGVSWYDAVAYARWAGKRLPTEAEWEKAARGTAGRKYPWGDEFDPTRAQSAERIASRPIRSLADEHKWFEEWSQEEEGKKSLMQGGPTVPVGSFAQGASPFGCSDMAGNVAEWVSDWMDEEYYSKSPEVDPTGPSGGEMRVVRGGAWDAIPSGKVGSLRCADREARLPDDTDMRLGFRCAMDVLRAVSTSQPQEEEDFGALFEVRQLINAIKTCLDLDFDPDETEHYFVCSTFDRDTTREVGRRCEGLYKAMANALGISKREPVWKGKCVLWLFEDAHDYVLFALDVDNRSGTTKRMAYALVNDGWAHVAAGLPYSKPPGPDDKRTTSEQERDRRLEVEKFRSALLRENIRAFIACCKGAVKLPLWVQAGLTQYFESLAFPDAEEWKQRRKTALEGAVDGAFMDLRKADQPDQENSAIAWSVITFLVQRSPDKFAEFFKLLKEGKPDDEALLLSFGTKDLVKAYDKEKNAAETDDYKLDQMRQSALRELERSWLEAMKKERESKGT